ncbi:MAG: hypothetical protein IK122_00350 [Alphaproteobacteria bacterium]|nr:hypothetical protein [Alphaproteobacteria bacterium]
MAQSKNVKQMHARQVVLAEEQFEAYKDFIVKEFVDKFGGSYQTAEGLKKVWRSVFIYTQKCENFLIEKTVIFLGCALSSKNRDFQSPTFFKNLIGKISEYLAVYIEKKGEPRNACSQRLRDIFTKNGHVQSRTKEYVNQNQKAWAKKQKAQKKFNKKEPQSESSQCQTEEKQQTKTNSTRRELIYMELFIKGIQR